MINIIMLSDNPYVWIFLIYCVCIAYYGMLYDMPIYDICLTCDTWNHYTIAHIHTLNYT